MEKARGGRMTYNYKQFEEMAAEGKVRPRPIGFFETSAQLRPWRRPDNFFSGDDVPKVEEPGLERLGQSNGL